MRAMDATSRTTSVDPGGLVALGRDVEILDDEQFAPAAPATAGPGSRPSMPATFLGDNVLHSTRQPC